MSDKSIREILCENCKMNCKLLANNALVFGCFFNHSTNEGLQKAFESYESQYKAEIEELKKENESLKKKLEKAEEVIEFYGDKENWLFTGMYCNTGKHKITDRMQAINGWHDQHKSIVNSDIENHSDYLMFGGKLARAYLKENNI